MSKHYEIRNVTSGHSLGVYEADTEAQALDLLAQDAGYADAAEAATVAGEARLDVIDLDDMEDQDTMAAWEHEADLD